MNTVQAIVREYGLYLSRMKILNGLPQDPLFQISAWVVSQAYTLSTPESRFPVREFWPTDPREYIQLQKYERHSHVVYTFGEEAFVGFRGLDLSDPYDIYRGIQLMTEDYPGDPNLLQEMEEIQKSYPKLYLAGHSYGGAKANWLSRTMETHPPAYLLNPAQGFDPAYRSRYESQPQIQTFSIVGDYVSRFAGLENPDGIHLIRMENLKSCHGIANFVPETRPSDICE